MSRPPKNTGNLIFDCDVDPKLVSVNLRYKNNGTIHAVVRRNQEKIRKAAKWAAETSGWRVPAGPLGIELHFTFSDLRGDGDNPIKRTIDAIHTALNFDDSKIVEGHWFRKRGTPGIRAILYETVPPNGESARHYSTVPSWDFEDDE